MSLKQEISRMLPPSVRTGVRIRKERRQLSYVHPLRCEINPLRRKSEISLADIFGSPEIEEMWSVSKREIDRFPFPDGRGGVNPGDRRALYYLISALKPSSVLEVGTHIGASTLHIASALYMSRVKHGAGARLTSVDIADVNSPVAKPWLNYGTRYSPREMMNELGYGDFVEFVADDSLHYTSTSRQLFDFIFLDGDHAAKTVYQEVPNALKLLNPNGVILLHDYFPEMKPLWPGGSVIPGPTLGTDRLASEGANLTVVPLGRLPWTTKMDSHLTSLALLLRNE